MIHASDKILSYPVVNPSLPGFWNNVNPTTLFNLYPAVYSVKTTLRSFRILNKNALAEWQKIRFDDQDLYCYFNKKTSGIRLLSSSLRSNFYFGSTLNKILLFSFIKSNSLQKKL
jgi:hypothetical protein